MIEQTLKDQLLFLREIEKLKTVNRMNKTLDGRQENSAEHSWHVALMAFVLEQYTDKSLDLLKVIKMLLIHDLVEIDAGDTWLYDSEANQVRKHAAEMSAAERLFSLLPQPQREDYLMLWKEFEALSTNESKYASAIDGIQPLLNHLVTGSPNDGAISLEKIKDKKSHIATSFPRLGELVDQLIEESVGIGLYK